MHRPYLLSGERTQVHLEAQIRGSRYAWDMRVVGVESLVKLMHIKEKSTEDATVRQIRELLRPFEYTRVDRIVDVIFDTATDVEQSSDTAAEDVATSSAEVTDIHSQERTAPEALDAMRDRIVAALQRRLGVPLVRRRRALFESADGRKRVCITISKRHDREYQPYWYAYHPAWNDFLKGAEQAMFVLGCMERDEAYAIPLSNFSSFLPKLNQTLGDGSRNYWHVIITPNEDGGLALYSSSTGDKLDLRPYAVSLDPVSTPYTAHRAAG
jgi:hypothetical protein